MSQTATIAISLEELAIVLSILRARIPDRAVWVFGSRANGNARRRSDLDLAVDGDEPLPLRLRSELAEDFDQSDLPYRVDVVDLASITPEFRKHIEGDFIPLTATHPDNEDDGTPFDKLREECGVMAVYGHPDAARMTYWGLYALQHRGQESAGIASSDGQDLNDIKGMGLVSEIFTDEVLATLPGHMAIGHTRYSTTGDSALLNAQPISVESTKGLIAIAHNGNLVNLGNSKERLERDGAVFQTTSDSEIIVQMIAHSRCNTLVDCIAQSLAQVEGAFSIVMMTRNRIFAARDPHGFRPLSMGRIAGVEGAPDTFVFASETCAFDLLHAKYERDVRPGELVMVSEDGVTSRRFAPETTPPASCIFEHVYFARPDSRIFGRWVQQSREEMGRQLARESGVVADLVVPVPDSGVTAALGYAAESGIPFNFGLIRNHYVGRTFIQPEQRTRDFGVRMKLNPVRNLLEGKRIILIDDSIIRGTTSRKIVRMVRAAGAKEVHMRISCPPTISPCFYGVDTPSKRELIAANKSIDEIREFIEADSLAYLSLVGLTYSCTTNEPATGMSPASYCTACYTGNYPTAWVDVEDILPATVGA
ncbi:MAG TPA: amidophosphoribosyltransferase [Acidobacteriaceae bacterium]|jgi:amidophosphoribosyltransferase|nr:amidophosphoribosyltransferase [Acidobacteriaceae bacterium]